MARMPRTPRAGVDAAAAGVALLLAAALATAAPPPIETTHSGPLLGGTVDAALVGDYEAVADPLRGTAPAGVAVRSRVRWDSPEAYGLRAVLGVDDLDARVQRAGPFDPTTRLALPLRDRGASPQAALAWRDRTSTVTLGRQRLPLLGERAVAAPGWRAGAQTYDALAVSTQVTPRSELRYAYAAGVNAPATLDAPATRLRGEFHMLDGTVRSPGVGAVSGFAYRVSLPGDRQTSTFGLDWRRDVVAGPLGRLPVGVSYSTATSRAASAPAAAVPASARYLQLDAGLGIANTRVKLGRGTSTTAPASASLLAPLYGRNGGVGAFAVAPLPGGVDTYALLQTELAGTTLEVGRHEFRGATPAGDLDAWSTTLTHRVSTRVHVQASVADSRGPSAAPAARSFWLQFGASLP